MLLAQLGDNGSQSPLRICIVNYASRAQQEIIASFFFFLLLVPLHIQNRCQWNKGMGMMSDNGKEAQQQRKTQNPTVIRRTLFITLVGHSCQFHPQKCYCFQLSSPWVFYFLPHTYSKHWNLVSNVYALRTLNFLDLMTSYHRNVYFMQPINRKRSEGLPGALPTFQTISYRFSPWMAECSEKCLMKLYPLCFTEKARINILNSHIQMITVIQH